MISQKTPDIIDNRGGAMEEKAMINQIYIFVANRRQTNKQINKTKKIKNKNISKNTAFDKPLSSLSQILFFHLPNKTKQPRDATESPGAKIPKLS